MNSRALQHCIFFLSCLSLSSGSITSRPLFKVVKHDKILDKQEKKILFSSSVSVTEHAGQPSIPVVNPSPDSTQPTTPTQPQMPPVTPTTPTQTQMPPVTPTTPSILPPNPPSTPMTPQNPTTPTTPQNPTTAPSTPQSPTTTAPSSGGGSWCVAKPGASPNALQVGLDYACGIGGAECSAIQPGASCYNPNTIKDHASYAFNSYYHKHPGPNSCDFGGIAQLTKADPSTGNCRYASSSSSNTPTTNSGTTPPASLSSPGSPTMTTPTSIFPGGPTDYGAEPTGLPNTANSKLCCILLLIMSSLFGSIIPIYYI